MICAQGRAQNRPAKRRSERGAAAVEMALVGTLLLTLALGGGEYGLLMATKHDLNVATRLAGRVASTPCADTGSGTSTGGCNRGNTDFDDFTILRAIESGLGGKMSSVEKIIVYGTPARSGSQPFAISSGRPPSICLSAAAGVNYVCNIYTDATLIEGTNLKLFDNLDYFYEADGGFDRTRLEETFNCIPGSTSPTLPYCPTGSDANGIPLRLRSLNGATSMGIYVKLHHNFVTGFIRDEQKLSDWTMFRLEPHPLVNETLRQCDPTVDSTCIAAATSVQITVTDATVTESPTVGNCASVRVSINIALDTPQSVVLTTADDTAEDGLDYDAQNVTVNLPAGVTSQDVCIPIIDDSFFEQPEGFTLTLRNGSAGLKDSSGNLAGKTTGVVTINDDDAQPTLSVNDVTVNEGGDATFTVTMSQPMGTSASFNWSTADDTAVAPGDYDVVTATGVTFAPGQTTKTLTVSTNTDNITETSERFRVNLVVLSGASSTGGKLVGLGNITDQTAAPIVSVGDPPAGVNEGSNLVFPITLDHPASTALTVKWSTVSGTATSTLDYTGVSLATVTFAAGVTTASATVTTINDSIDELSPEDLTVVLSNPSSPLTIGTSSAIGLINDNDSPPTVGMTPTSVTVIEGGSTTFTITLSRASFQDVTVTFSTVNGTAISTSDYAAQTTAVTFLAGQTSKTVTVNTTNDSVIEPTESFTVNAVGGVGTAANTVTGTVTITDDDTPTTTSTTTTTTRPATTTTRATTTTTRPATTTTRATTTTTRATTSTTRPATTTTRAATTTTRAATTTTRAATTTTRAATTTTIATTTTRATTTTSTTTTTTTTRPTTTTSTTTTTRPTTTTSTTTTTRPTTTTTRPTTTTTRPATTTTVVIIDGNT